MVKEGKDERKRGHRKPLVIGDNGNIEKLGHFIAKLNKMTQFRC